MLVWYGLWIVSFTWMWYYGMPSYAKFIYFYMYFSGTLTLLIMIADLDSIYQLLKDKK